MSSTVLYMSMSLDGFIAGPNERPDNGLGDGAERLHEWAMTEGGDVDLEAIRRSGGVNGKVINVTTAMTQAKEAAGDRHVLVHGAGTAQLALAAGVLDEIELHVIPVLFGQGRRLFEGLAAEQIELERTRILEGEDGV
jgi:dihydrofolate reductase